MTSPCPSDLELDEHLRHPSRWSEHVGSCARCQTRVVEAQALDEHFDQIVYPVTRARVRASVKQSGRRKWWAWGSLIAVPAMAALVLVALPREPAPDYVGTKGSSLLVAFVRDGDQARILHEGDAVPLNAHLRFEARVAQGCWWTVLSVDGEGTVSQLYPERGAVYVSRPELLPLGAVLDDHPGPERLFAFCAPSEVPTDELRRAVRSSVAPSSDAVRATRRVKGLPEGVTQDTLLVEKTP